MPGSLLLLQARTMLLALLGLDSRWEGALGLLLKPGEGARSCTAQAGVRLVGSWCLEVPDDFRLEAWDVMVDGLSVMGVCSLLSVSEKLLGGGPGVP